MGQPKDADAALLGRLQRWAEGKSTLKEVRGYSDEELYAIAKTAFFYYGQGKTEEARTLFQGLYAVNPTDGYFAKALGVVEYSAGNVAGALAAYELALKLDPQDIQALVGRAEIRLAEGETARGLDDLRRAVELGPPENPIITKASALLASMKPSR